MERAKEIDQRKVTTETLGLASIDDYEDDVFYVWGHVDRARSLLDIWSRVVEHTSRLAEGLRRDLYNRVQLELAGVAVWVMTFTGQARRAALREGADHLIRVQSPLSEIIWFKYPGICPLCEKEKCVCLADLKTVEARHEKPDQAEIEKENKNRRQRVRTVAKQKLGAKVSSLDGLENMFEGIYTSNILAWPIEGIAFHLFEEIGEVTMAITRMYTYSEDEPNSAEYHERLLELENEIADVLSWLFSLSVKLKMVFTSFDSYVKDQYTGIQLRIAPDIRLSSAILHKYCDTTEGGKLFCKTHCKKQPICTCPIRVFTGTEQASQLAQKLKL